MFSLENFVDDCLTAARQDSTHRGVAEVMARAMSDPSGIIAALGEPTKSGIVPIYKSPELTIINLAWKPLMTVPPHNHEMWAVIGIYGGREDNIFWRRVKDDPDGHIEAAGARALGTGDYVPLGKDIHPFRDEPDLEAHWRDPCLWRGFLRGRAQRVGRREPDRTPLRHRQGQGDVQRLAPRNARSISGSQALREQPLSRVVGMWYFVNVGSHRPLRHAVL